MSRTRSGILSVLLSVALMLTGTANVALADTEPPPPPATASPVPGAQTSDPESPAPDPATAAPTTEAPGPETLTPATGTPAPKTEAPAPAPATETPAPAVEAAAALPEPVTDLPGLFIDLPDGYDLADLHASKDEIPADPDVEPHSLLTLVDPSNPSHNLEGASLEAIKSRGNFTWLLEKKPYQIKFDSSTPVLGLPTAKTWILLANHADPSLMRNKVAYDLAVEFGLPASPDSRFVDVTIEGQYLGNYLLTEKVEVKANRLELQDPGGILLELDNNYGLAEDFHFTTATSNSLFVLKDAVEDVEAPLPAPLAAAYADIQDYLDEFESYLYAADPDWSKISAMIDVDSFIKYYFVFEVAENPEITQSSVFFYRDGPNDVLHAGPVWDFDSALASYTVERLGGDPVQDYIKNARFLRNTGNGWFTQLFRNEEFVALVNQMYEEELQDSVEALPGRIDAYAAEIQQSAAANFERWNVLGQPSVFGAPGHIVADTWEGEVSYLRDWVERRVAHLGTAYSSGMPILQYAPHVADLGWQPAMTSGQIAGTSGRTLQLEALDIALLPHDMGGTLQSNAHIQNIGWNGWQTGDTSIGTTGMSLQLEAVRFRLTDQLATSYDISYRVHVQNIGWMGWVRNGSTAGTTGLGLQIEAIQIRLLDKTEPATGPSVEYSAHVANIGWMPHVADGAVAGTTGRSLALEAIKAELTRVDVPGDLEYRAHVQNIGWMAWTDSSNSIGTVGRALQLEALEIRLTGELADHYSIRYRTHVQDIGWQDWVADGQTAGTTGQGKRAEAVIIELVPKAP